MGSGVIVVLGVSVGVSVVDGTSVGSTVTVGVGVTVGEGSGVSVGSSVGVGVISGVSVGVSLGDGVLDGVSWKNSAADNEFCGFEFSLMTKSLKLLFVSYGFPLSLSSPAVIDSTSELSLALRSRLPLAGGSDVACVSGSVAVPNPTLSTSAFSGSFRMTVLSFVIAYDAEEYRSSNS